MLGRNASYYFLFIAAITFVIFEQAIISTNAKKGNQFEYTDWTQALSPKQRSSLSFSLKSTSMSRKTWFSQYSRQIKNTNNPDEDEDESKSQALPKNNPSTSSPETAEISVQEGREPLTVDTRSTKPKYFSGQYEYEVSPSNSPINIPKDEVPITASAEIIAEVESDSNTNNSTVIMERMVPVTKTVFLIRHAQSDENRRLASLTNTFKGLARFKLPQKSDVVASCELLNVPAQIDSDVSPEGKAQIDALGKQIEKDNFVQKMGIQLVAHSPLKRARQTSHGMLKCVTPSSKPGVTLEEDYSAHGEKAASVGRVVELPVLSERTPLEWLPVNHDAFTKRISEFETWLGDQPEDVIAIVGHSQYFKSMLGLPKKFKNVDVWSLQFDSSVKKTHDDVKEEINTKERIERSKKLKKKLDGVLNAGSGHGSEDVSSDCGSTDGNDEAIDGDEDRAASVEKTGTRNNHDSEVFETANEIYEIDGVRVDDLDLPRGWRDLKRHYTYDPSMSLEDEKE